MKKMLDPINRVFYFNFLLEFIRNKRLGNIGQNTGQVMDLTQISL